MSSYAKSELWEEQGPPILMALLLDAVKRRTTITYGEAALLMGDELGFAINKYHIGMLPYLVEKLASIDEGGSTLLDKSLIVYGSPMADGNLHNHRSERLYVATIIRRLHVAGIILGTAVVAMFAPAGAGVGDLEGDHDRPLLKPVHGALFNDP